jgi:cis-3-alkyl-4-acyloxetan-2-one decarboxylase
VIAGAPAAHADARDVATAWRTLYPFESHFLRVGGHALHYLDEGPKDAPPLLLLHGNPTWSFLWREVVARFRGRFRVVAPDHLGCGLSDKPQRWGYRLADHVANLEAIARALDLRDVTLGVHDWGGAIGMGFATRQPERVARLVISNSAAFRSRRLPLRIAACRVPLFGPLAVRGLNAFARAALRMATAKGLEPAVADGLLAPYGSWGERVAIQRFVDDIPMRPGHPSWPALLEIEQGLPRLREKPALILWGERDWCFTPAFREEWQRRLPNARAHAFADAGHYVLEDARERVLEAMQDFLRPVAR